MNNPFLIGASIYLRPLERQDAERLAPWINDPENRRLLRINSPINIQRELDFIDRVAGSEHDLVLGIALYETDQLIGATGFHEIDFRNRHCQFGITIGDKELQGKGHGTEATKLMLSHAFQTMNLNRVHLMVYEYNERAIRVYARLGFKQEGVLRQDNFRDGRYWDTHVMGLLREEWRA